MRKVAASVIAFGLLAAPALADRKLDEAVAKAEDQLQKGKPEDALKTLTKLTEQNPSGEAFVALARLQERLGNLDDAAATLAKAKDASPAGPARAEVLAAWAGMDLLRGTGKDALAHATAAVEQVKASPTASALAALARAQARNQDAASALLTAEKAVAASPNGALAHEARGEALLGLGRAEDAAAAFRKALELDPKLTLARTRLASALLAQGKKTEAVAEARKATEVDPKAGEAFAVLGTAILAENPKNWPDAIAQAQQGAFLNPKSPLVQVAVGKIFEANGNLDQAVNAYKKALETDPGYGPSRLALVQAQIAKGDKEGAFAEAQRLATDMPGSGEAQLELGRILLRKNDYAGAIPPLERAVNLTPGTPEAHALLGRAYQFSHRSEDAAPEYKKAVELDAKNLDYRTTYGLLLGITGQHEAGIAELKKVIATPGYKDSAAYVNLGWIYRNMNKATESIAAYKRALEIDPKGEQAGQAALGLGWAYSYTKAWDDSIAAFNRAIQIDPKTAGEAYNGIAWCYFFKKDMAQAQTFLDKAQAAGRNAAALKENIERVKKALASGHAVTEEQLAQAQAEQEKERERAVKLEAASEGIRARSPATRIRSLQTLTSLGGAEAVPSLVWLLETDKDYSVREAAANALGSLGPAGRNAIPNLKRCRDAPNLDAPTIATKDEMDAVMKQGDLKRACRDALPKIQK
jgi:tetratricopeptide (TPR) repeat protein